MSQSATRAPLPGWPHVSSPFHVGEQVMQARAGMRDRLESVGRRVVRGFMPDEHRELFEKLPYLFVGSEDADGFVWASLLTGEPGFIHSPNAETLTMGDVYGGLPAALGSLEVGQKLGILGIEFPTRRRNRANGVVCAVEGDALSVHIEQSFGNCAQYIHPRAHRVQEGWQSEGDATRRSAGAPLAEGLGRPRSSDEQALLSERARALIEGSDTFFIATTSGRRDDSETESAPEQGLDVSHRGGPPGFVRVTKEGAASVLTWPDFRGNYMFCTLGNLELDPRAGLVFVDFETGTTLALTGRALVVDGAPTDAESGAGRQLRFAVTRGVWAHGATPLRWERVESG